MRAFVEREIMPFCFEWDENYKLPKELWKKVKEYLDKDL
jgi:hypothetical protein